MRRTRGFSLIEAVVAIAIMAILAGAVAPLVVKALDQQKQSVTKGNLQAAWQAAFGTQGSRVPNMQADFGFTPAAGLGNLGIMLAASAGAPVPLAYGNHGGSFLYGWNGPYWSGSTVTVNGQSVPADAWGRAIQLTHLAGSGWQMLSLGPDGLANTADDVVYPASRVLLPQDLAGPNRVTLYVSIVNNRLAAATGTITITDRDLNAARTWNPIAFNVPASNPQTQAAVFPIPGLVDLSVSVNSSLAVVGPPAIPAYPVGAFSQVVDLLPGDTRIVTFTVN